MDTELCENDTATASLCQPILTIENMKTYEGTFTILWYKNAIPDIRPLTIDCEGGGALAKEIERIRQDFRTKGDDPACPQYQAWHDGHVPPYRIIFNIHERR